MKRTSTLTARLHLRCSEDVKERIQENANNCGRSLSEYVVYLMANQKPPSVKPPAEVYSFLSELKKIGVNMNQIARVANSTGDINEEAYNRNLVALMELVERFEKEVLDGGDT